MKRLLFLFAVLMIFVMADNRCMAADGIIAVPLSERIKNHPDAVEIQEGWWRITVKENISDTKFDWRFDRRKIEVAAGHIAFGHRLEQNSGSTPNANWVVEYTFVDRFGDGTLDYFDKVRFITIEQGDVWLRTTVRWPDNFRYPYPTKEEQSELYKEELEYWENKLK